MAIFLLVCVATMVLAATLARWWVLWLPVAFGVITALFAANPEFGVVGTALRVGMWVIIVDLAAAAVILARRHGRSLAARARPFPRREEAGG